MYHFVYVNLLLLLCCWCARVRSFVRLAKLFSLAIVYDRIVLPYIHIAAFTHKKYYLFSFFLCFSSSSLFYSWNALVFSRCVCVCVLCDAWRFDVYSHPGPSKSSIEMDPEHTHTHEHTIVYIIHVLDRQREPLAQLNEIYSEQRQSAEMKTRRVAKMVMWVRWDRFML